MRGYQHRPGVGANSSMSTPTIWTGEPRVVYNDVLDKVNSLKASRGEAARLAAFVARKGRKHDNGRRDDDASGSAAVGKRLVSFMFDLPPGPYHKTRLRLPEIWVVDAEGRETRKNYHGPDLGPLDVGSVIVLRDRANGGAPVAAYVVGEEEYQV